MRLDSTCKDYIIGEPPDQKDGEWFLRAIAAIMTKTKVGKSYRIRHRKYLTGTEGSDHAGMITTERMTMTGKYPAGALFRTERGWNEFFTWQELAAGGISKS